MLCKATAVERVRRSHVRVPACTDVLSLPLRFSLIGRGLLRLGLVQVVMVAQLVLLRSSSSSAWAMRRSTTTTTTTTTSTTRGLLRVPNSRFFRTPPSTQTQNQCTRTFQSTPSVPRTCLAATFLDKDSFPSSSPSAYRHWHRHSHSHSHSPRQVEGLPRHGIQSRTQCWLSSSTTSMSTDESTASTAAAAAAAVDDHDHDDSAVAAYKELQWLSQEIKRLDEIYYNDNDGSSSSSSIDDNNDKEKKESLTRISNDDDYDAYVQREADLCRKYPLVLQRWEQESGLGIAATRYGGRVGVESTPPSTTSTESATTTVTDRVKRQHVRPMLSLDNVNNDKELLAWLERVRKKLVASQTKGEITVVTEPKLDGVSLSLHYVRHDNDDDDNDNGNISYSNQSNYRLAWASTRGDGKRGQDVTAAVLEGMKLPSSLTCWDKSSSEDVPDAFEIRGEVVMPQTVFESILANAENTTFSNARNAASGILLRKEQVETSTSTSSVASEYSSMELRSKLRFYAYDVVTSDNNIMLNGVEARERLDSLGFLVPQPIATTVLVVNNETAWDASDVPRMMEYHESLRLHREGSDQSVFDWGDYDMDGCVHKISEQAIRKTLGASNRAPRWAIAHKFPPLSAVTALLDIDVQVGRTGALTPVAILEPVDLRGVTVQRATLHNFMHMRQILGGANRIPKGSQVLVRRAGDVIPQVVQRVGFQDSSDDKNVSYISLDAPTTCPACGSGTIADIESKTLAQENSTAGQVLRCGGPQLLCPPRAVSALAHAYSRDALDLTGLSEARIVQLMDANLLQMPSDVFALAKDKTKLDAISELDGWGTKSAQNLARVANRVASDGVTLSRFIYSLSIRYAGVHSSALLASIYANVDTFLDDVEQAAKLKSDTGMEGRDQDSFAVLREENEATKGIGPVLLSSLEAFAMEKDLVKAARELAGMVRVVEDKSQALRESFGDDAVPSEAKPLLGMSVVFTGAIPDLSRPEAKKLAVEMGAKSTPGTISNATSLVVAGAKSGQKLDQAAKLGVRVIDADEFHAMVKSFQEGITSSDSTKE